MVSINRIFSSNYKSDKAIMKMHEKAAKEMDKYVCFSTPLEVSDNATEYARQLFEIKEMVQNYAKHNNVHVDMFIPKENDILNISVRRIGKSDMRENPEKILHSLPLGNELVKMEKDNPRMLVDKDELNYIANGKFTREDNFVRQVYHTVSSLVSKLNKTN